MKLFSTNFYCQKSCSLFIAALITCSLFSAKAQTVTIPSSNADDTTVRQPYGCFYGYERTEGLYLGSEINNSNYITEVGFYLNSTNAPAQITPVVIKMKSTSSSSLTSATYDSASLNATTVWSGNITSAMLSAGSWVTITLTNPFNYSSSNNLEVFVEANYGSTGGENWDSKGFRQHNTGSARNQYWENDVIAPTDHGELRMFQPNIELTLQALCSGTPDPGNTLSTEDSVCSGSPFTLSLQNISAGGGLSYQWQSSNDGNSWSLVSGATNATYTTSQTAMKYYRCVVTCSNGGLSGTSTALQVNMQLFYHCYCESYAETTEDTKIDSVHLGAINSGSDPFHCESYTDYTGGNSAALTAGQPSTIHIVNGSCTGQAYAAYVAVYIDYNHNTTFDAAELAYSYGPILNLNSIPDGTFFVSQTASAGLTGMRIVLAEGEAVPSACGTYTRGETEDYLVNITAIPSCTGAPDTTSTLSSLYSVCPGEDFTLSLLHYPNASGITYLWQQSADNNNWTNAPGTNTNPTYADTGQTSSTYYRCVITCSNGGASTNSFSVNVTMNPFYYCYCQSGPSDVLTNDTKIDSLQFGTINTGSDPNHCESYTDYTNNITDVALGLPTTIHIVNGSCDQQFYEAFVGIYIDGDHDGNYQDNELVYSYGPTTGLNSIPFDNVIVNGAQLGLTGMRVIIAEGDSAPPPCGFYEGGETEDYLVNIVASDTCQDPPIAGTTIASVTSVCSAALPVDISLSLNGNSNGAGQTYQWQDSVSGSWNNLAGETEQTATVTINGGSDTIFYRCQVHCGVHTVPSTKVMVAVNPTPIGDTYLTPILVTSLPYTDFNNNFSSSCFHSDYIGAYAQASPDVFYKVTTSAIGVLEVSTCNTTTLNTVIHILNNVGIQLVGNDDDGPLCAGIEASATDTTTAVNQTFYVVVEGQSTSEGNYELDINLNVGSGVNQGVDNASEISLFPNPNNGTFDLAFDLKQNVNDIASVSITNVLGQIMDEEKIAVVNGKLSKEISLSKTASDGLYFVNIKLSNFSLNKRFMVQR